MADTYCQFYLHFVFAVQSRLCLIHEGWKPQLYHYMSGIIERQGHKCYSINGMPDHVHLLISMNPKQAPSDLMYHVKRSSSLWINEKKFIAGRFSWQEGFGGFSYGKSQLPDIIRYIERQPDHHKKKTFIEEYKAFLRLYNIEFDERYIYKSID